MTGQIVVNHLSTPMGQIMPIMDQAGFQPTHYINFVDGPPPIGEFSKDLAFELYTVPEPAAALLLIVALVGVVSPADVCANAKTDVGYQLVLIRVLRFHLVTCFFHATRRRLMKGYRQLTSFRLYLAISFVVALFVGRRRGGST